MLIQELEEAVATLQGTVIHLEERIVEVEKEMFDLIQSANSGMAELDERIKVLEKKP
jgi:hypothetical protein